MPAPEEHTRDTEAAARATGASERAAAPEPGPPEAGAPAPEPSAVGEEAVPGGGPAAGEAEEPFEAVTHDLEELRAKAGERDDYLRLAQRTQADFENYRKRMAREATQAANRGIGKLAKELLPALDHLELALRAAQAEGGELYEGVRLVQQELLAALGRVGIEPFDPRGTPFDPNEHEAMAQQPAEGAESGTVLEVYQQGYRLNGSILRPARVVVAQ